MKNQQSEWSTGSIRSEEEHKHNINSTYNQKNNNILNSIHFLLNSDPIWLTRWIINLFQTTSSTKQLPHIQLQILIDILSESTNNWLEKITLIDSSLKQYIDQNSENQNDKIKKLEKLIKEDQQIAESCSAKWFSIQIKIKWEAYNCIYQNQFHQNESDSKKLLTQEGIELEEEDVPVEEYWNEIVPDSNQNLEEIPTFFSFFQSNFNQLALEFASRLELNQLRKVIEIGQVKLDQFTIFDSIPLHARPTDPDYGEDLIALLPRPTHNLAQTSDISQTILAAIFNPIKYQTPLSTSFTDQQLTDWYLTRIETIDQITGSIDTAIEIIQHGAALGVTGLESIAEDLSLLSKLIYTIHPSSIEITNWTLKEWRSKSPDEIIQACLSGSSPSSLTKDIHQLVLPYLGVLESRRARDSIPNAESTIPDALRNWALKQSNQLLMLEALINASSPALKLHQRLIKSNRDLAQILIACFYTSSSIDQWELMGRMFECMPAFSDPIPSSDEFNSLNYLQELLSTPSSTSVWTSEGTQMVHDALIQIDTGRLSAILDGLDDHLTTGEVLARWNVPVKLGELVIKFHKNKISQEKLATRLARQEGGIEMESEEEWEVLLEAMIELSQPGRALDLLDKDEVTKLFFSGLLTSAKFKLAKSLFSSSGLDPTLQEELVITASREFYDNSDTADLQRGNMKLAYDCLTVAPQTLKIKKERDFIEATCRLVSFKLESQPGILMSPIEFRLKPNKLELISKLLQVNPTTYQQVDMIIELINKLGYGKDLLVEIKALSMVVDFAIEERDLLIASHTCERMISILEIIKKSNLSSSSNTPLIVDQASEVTWKVCAKIGRYSGPIHNESLKGLKTKFIAHAIIICPSDRIPGLLSEWKAAEILEEAEDEQVAKQTLKSNSLSQDQDPTRSFSQHNSWYPIIEIQKSKSEGVFPTSSTSSSGIDFGVGSDLASRTIERATSLFPFSNKSNSILSSSNNLPNNTLSSEQVSNIPITSDDFVHNSDFTRPLNALLDSNNDSSSTSKLSDRIPTRFSVNVDTDKITSTLSHTFTSGVGWLIGATEDDLNS